LAVQFRKSVTDAFSDTTLQTAVSADTAYAMTFDTTDAAMAYSIGSPASSIVVDNQGVYNVQFSAQLDKTSGRRCGYLYSGLRINGTLMCQTATSSFSIDKAAMQSWCGMELCYSHEPTHYVELMWSTSDDQHVVLLAASATSVYPAIPSVICTVTQVNNL
jgi:hypothetical protein